MTISHREQFIDTVIVGGSLAGSSLALQLLRDGRSVCIIDREVFPRSKSCGEGLSGAGYAELLKLGLGDLLKKSSYTHFDGYEIKIGQKRIHLPSFPIYGVSSSRSTGIGRHTLDGIILDQLRHHPNLVLLEGVTVDGVKRHNGEFLVDTKGGLLRSSFLVGADGANSKVARCFGDNPIGEKNRYALSLWFETPVSLDRILIVVRNEYEVFFTKISSGLLNCSILSDLPETISRDRVKLLRDIALIAKEELSIALPPPSQLRGTTLHPGVRRRPSVPNLLYVGDAAEVFDPIGGMGMTHALTSSRLAAKCITSSRRERDNTPEFQSYERERARDAREFRAFTRMVSLILKGLPDPVSRAAIRSAKGLHHLPLSVQRSAIQLLSSVAGA